MATGRRWSGQQDPLPKRVSPPSLDPRLHPSPVVLKNIGSNWTLNLVQILVFMVLTSFTSDILGDRGYGIWESIVSATGPLQLLVLGVPMATVRTISERLGKGDPSGANQALGESVSLTIILGLVALLAGLVLYAIFPSLSSGWHLEPERAYDARTALLIVSINLAIGFALRLPYAVFDAHHDFFVRNLIMALGFVTKLGLTVLLLTWRTELRVLAAVQVTVALIEFAVAWLVSTRRHAPVRFGPGPISLAGAKSILSFSIFAFLLNMGALLAFRLDAVVIAAFMQPEDVTIYGFGNKIFDPLINLLLAIGMVVMPMASDLRSRGRADEVRDIFLRWSKIASIIVLMIGGYLLVLGPAFLDWWLDPTSRESGRLMQVLMLSFFLFLPVRAVALPVLMGLGKPKGPALGLAGMGLANLLLSLSLIGPFGLMGVALGTAIPNVLFGLWFAKVACSQLKVSFGEWVAYVLARGLLATVLCTGTLMAVNHQYPIHGFWPLVFAGLTYVACYLALQVLFVFRGDRFTDLYALAIAKLRPAS